MSPDHDPAAGAAGYVAGELTAPERAAFEDRLEVCEVCRAEVASGRRGKALVEQARETAPPWLRTRITDAIATSRAPRRRRRSRVVLVAAAAAAIAIAAFSGVVAQVRRVDPAPDPVAAAVADYREARLPGSAPPQPPAPDLGALPLTHMTAGAGGLAGQPVTAHAYRDPAGRRVTVYISDRAFPMPADAEQPAGPAEPWTAVQRGVTVLCASEPHELLVVGDDRRLVVAAADLLDVT